MKIAKIIIFKVEKIMINYHKNSPNKLEYK